MKAFLLALTMIAGAAVSAAPAKPQVTLSINANRTLPGLAVPLELRVKNGASALHIAPAVRVFAISPAGESFFLTWGENGTSGDLDVGLTDEEDPSFNLPANNTADFAVPALDLSRPSWALDPRMLALPGEWSLQVQLFTDDEADPIAVSNFAKLTVATPTGRDVATWEAIRRREYWGAADKLNAENPESPYFPYLATLVARLSTMEKVGIISRAMELHPNSPAVPSLRYAVALYYGMEADRVFFKDRNFDKAVSLAEKGRAELSSMKNGRDAWSKRAGEARLAEFPSRDGFLTLQRLQREKGRNN
ncbi:MAG TPA: hypothetical protein VM733_01390 [Thermoanaerobaculia bacterium]|nr:hypothetical protein [Thermoanaerobaculia bacterium]